MKTIVALTDFSDDSVNAVLYAAEMCKKLHCSLAILNVCFTPDGMSDIPVMADTISGWLEDAEQQMKLLAGKVRFHVAGKIVIETEVLQGPILQNVSEFCDKMNPVAVVLGAESAGALERLFFGGHTLQAIKELYWPLLVVPSRVSYCPVMKVGLTCDFKNGIDTKAALQVRHLMELLDAELYVLHASTSGYLDKVETEQADAIMLMFATMSPSLHCIVGSNKESTILLFAEQKAINLLITIPKHHYFPSNIWHKSFSKGLVLQAHLPVFAVHQ